MEEPIAAESKLSAVLARYPSAGPIIFQSGRTFVARPRDLYAQYPGLTVGEYARLNDLDVAALVARLRAEAEAAEAQPRTAGDDDEAPTRWRMPLALGYTAGYREREDRAPGARSVVAVQSAHGPE